VFQLVSDISSWSLPLGILLLVSFKSWMHSKEVLFNGYCSCKWTLNHNRGSKFKNQHVAMSGFTLSWWCFIKKTLELLKSNLHGKTIHNMLACSKMSCSAWEKLCNKMLNSLSSFTLKLTVKHCVCHKQFGIQSHRNFVRPCFSVHMVYSIIFWSLIQL